MNLDFTLMKNLRQLGILVVVLNAACGEDTKTQSSDAGTTTTKPDASARPPRNTAAAVEGDGISCVMAVTLKDSCWTCHGARPANGAPYSLISRAELLMASGDGQTRLQRAISRMRSTTNPMPPRGQAMLPEAAIKVFEDWMKEGAQPLSCASSAVGRCQSCADMAENFATCKPQGAGLPNLCNIEKGPSFFICAAQECSKQCGLATMPGGTPAMPCDPANSAMCKGCLETECGAQLEACK